MSLRLHSLPELKVMSRSSRQNMTQYSSCDSHHHDYKSCYKCQSAFCGQEYPSLMWRLKCFQNSTLLIKKGIKHPSIHMFIYVYALWWHVTAEMLEPRFNTCIVYNGWSTVCYWSFTPRFARIICYIKYLQTLHGFYSLQINVGTCKGKLIPMETNYRGTQSKDLWQGQCQIIYTRLKGEKKKESNLNVCC